MWHRSVMYVSCLYVSVTSTDWWIWHDTLPLLGQLFMSCMSVSPSTTDLWTWHDSLTQINYSCVMSVIVSLQHRLVNTQTQVNCLVSSAMSITACQLPAQTWWTWQDSGAQWIRHDIVIQVNIHLSFLSVSVTSTKQWTQQSGQLLMSCLSVSVTSTSQQRTWHLWYRLANLASQSVMAWVKVKKFKTKCPLQCSSL